ncbi:TlyA family RNA methyltransferase [Natronospora cellulosivora (SeqCode)]
MASKKRLDSLVVERGFFENRSQAKRAIMAGMIIVDGQLVDKAGTQVKTDVKIGLKGEISPYVSRGGLKLEKALKVFALNPENKEAIDIGASTGGFTDCLLQNGASKVYAIDVGYGQLAWKLRQDKRVEVIERTNFRYLSKEQLAVEVPVIVTDVSFISLRLIIPAALKFLDDDGDIIALIKPQFEAGPDRVGKNGLVRDKNVHMDVILELMDFFKEINLKVLGLNFSPIMGANSKNIEFLVHLKKALDHDEDFITLYGHSNNHDISDYVKNLVEEAHNSLERS